MCVIELDEAIFCCEMMNITHSSIASYKCHSARHAVTQRNIFSYLGGTLHRLASCFLLIGAGNIFGVRQVCNKIFLISVCYLEKVYV